MRSGPRAQRANGAQSRVPAGGSASAPTGPRERDREVEDLVHARSTTPSGDEGKALTPDEREGCCQIVRSAKFSATTTAGILAERARRPVGTFWRRSVFARD